MDGDPEMHSGEIGDQFLTQKKNLHRRRLKEEGNHILSGCVCLCFKLMGLQGLYGLKYIILRTETIPVCTGFGQTQPSICQALPCPGLLGLTFTQLSW